MSFKDDSATFENWLREQCARIGCEVVEADLDYKHARPELGDVSRGQLLTIRNSMKS